MPSSPTSSAADTPSSGTVALFANRFLPYSQTFIYDEIRAHERYEVEVFCKERLNEDRFPYDRVHTPNGWLEQRIYENVRYWPPFVKMGAQGDYDVVHAHFGFAAMHAAPVAFRNDIPLVITWWGNDVSTLLGTQRYNPKNWDYIAFMPSIIRRAAINLCVSQEMAELVREVGGDSANVEGFRPGIDLDRYAPQDSASGVPQVILIGRFTEKKGHSYAIRAFARALEAGCDAHLTFVGGGDLRPQCQKLVADFGIQQHVTFSGILTPQQVADALASSDIALVPSVVAHNHDREGSPTVAKEASASGVPVIGTYHAGIPEMVEDGTTGILVPERRVDELTDALVTLLQDADLRERYGRAAREKMKREFNLSDRVRALESVYDRVR